MELNFIKSFILGIVQGVTEFIPISSTAHLILSAKLLKLELTDFLKSFIVIIQFGSILAVIFLYWKRVFSDWEMYFKKVLIAFIPTAILGLIFYSVVKNYLQESLEIISLALFLGGVLMIVFERRYKKKELDIKEKELNIKEGESNIEYGEVDNKIDSIKKMTYTQCFIIGLFQSLAMIPGVSRSAATILGGLSLGIGRVAIIEFSFLLAVPTMLAATVLDLFKGVSGFSSNEFFLLSVGFILSFVVAWFSIKFLLNFVRKNSFAIFGWYRVLIGAIIFSYLYL